MRVLHIPIPTANRLTIHVYHNSEQRVSGIAGVNNSTSLAKAIVTFAIYSAFNSSTLSLDLRPYAGTLHSQASFYLSLFYLSSESNPPLPLPYPRRQIRTYPHSAGAPPGMHKHLSSYWQSSTKQRLYAIGASQLLCVSLLPFSFSFSFSLPLTSALLSHLSPSSIHRTPDVTVVSNPPCESGFRYHDAAAP